MTQIPDISRYKEHRLIEDVDLEGHVVPGLTGRFYERKAGRRIAPAGVYSYRDIELFISWGYRDEPHCAYTAYRTIRGDWTVPHEGCPRMRTMPAAVVLDTGEREILLRTAPMRRVPAPGPAYVDALTAPERALVSRPKRRDPAV